MEMMGGVERTVEFDGSDAGSGGDGGKLGVSGELFMSSCDYDVLSFRAQRGIPIVTHLFRASTGVPRDASLRSA